VPSATREGRVTDILVPFDKIGHTEELCLLQEVDLSDQIGSRGGMPGFVHKIRVSVVTNGVTKFLKIEDAEERKALDQKPFESEGRSKMLELSIS